MSLIERSYSGQLFRPRPEIHQEEDGHLTIIATPWGPRASAKKAIQIIKDYFLSSHHDKEATSPFPRVACLSPLANDLRTAVKLANDTIYNEDNKNEFVSGVELLAFAKQGFETSYVQVGLPNVFLDRKLLPLVTFSSQNDLALEFSQQKKILPPLPGQLLGLQQTAEFSVQSFRPIKNDRFILISRSGVPADLYNLTAAERNIDGLSQVLATDDADLPYWLGIIDLIA